MDPTKALREAEEEEKEKPSLSTTPEGGRAVPEVRRLRKSETKEPTSRVHKCMYGKPHDVFSAPQREVSSVSCSIRAVDERLPPEERLRSHYSNVGIWFRNPGPFVT